MTDHLKGYYHDRSTSPPLKEDLLGYDWIANLLSLMDKSLPAESNVGLIKGCSAVHYRIAKMEEIVADYQGNLDGFIQFLNEKWQWRVTYNPEPRPLLLMKLKISVSALLPKKA